MCLFHYNRGAHEYKIGMKMSAGYSYFTGEKLTAVEIRILT